MADKHRAMIDAHRSMYQEITDTTAAALARRDVALAQVVTLTPAGAQHAPPLDAP